MQRLDVFPIDLELPRHVAMKDHGAVALTHQRARQLIAIRKDEDVDARLRCLVLRGSIGRREHQGESHKRNSGHTPNPRPIQTREECAAMSHLDSPPDTNVAITVSYWSATASAAAFLK